MVEQLNIIAQKIDLLKKERTILEQKAKRIEEKIQFLEAELLQAEKLVKEAVENGFVKLLHYYCVCSNVPYAGYKGECTQLKREEYFSLEDAVRLLKEQPVKSLVTGYYTWTEGYSLVV